MTSQPAAKRRITHRDVADRAGVSVATVSYVINHGPRPVSPEKRARVEEAVAALGYYPNALARSLRVQQTATVGLIVPNSANPFYAEVARELERGCADEGFLVLLCNSERDPTREARFVQMLRAKQVDGAVIIPHSDTASLLQPLLAAEIPVVILEHSIPGLHCIAIDDLAGGRLATRHLIELGHTRIAIIRRRQISSLSMMRFDGYRLELERAGIALDDSLVVETGPFQNDGYAAMRELLERRPRPTAVVTHNDIMALGALRAIYDAGLSVPGDISVVGYDDIAAAPYLVPPLTTIRSPKMEMGRLAAQMVLKLARDPASLPPQTVTLPVELVIRQSTRPISGLPATESGFGMPSASEPN